MDVEGELRANERKDSRSGTSNDYYGTPNIADGSMRRNQAE